MFIINEDNSIYVNRGDILFFSVSAKEEDGTPHHFIPGDVLRIKVYGKKEAETVVLEKDFPVTKNAEEVEIYLDKEETKIGELISKPKDYWYEVELNPMTAPQTIIGYGEDGACLFRLFPEGADVDEPYDPDPEDFPVVDEVLDITSPRPLANNVITKEFERLDRDVHASKEYVTPEMFGAVGDGMADDSDAFRMLADYARENNRELYCAEKKYFINSDVDFRYVKDVHIDGEITGDGVLIFGNSATSGQQANVYVSVANNVKVIGSKNGFYNFRRVNGTLTLYADGSVVSDTSIAYNQFMLGTCHNIVIDSVNGGWINENVFIGKRVWNITIGSDGTYYHNNNRFYDVNLEGGTVTINHGHNNYFRARGEGGITYAFNNESARNVIETDFCATQMENAVSKYHDTDGNLVTLGLEKYFKGYVLYSLSKDSIKNAYEVYPVAEGFKFAKWSQFYNSGLIGIPDAPLHIYINADKACYRPYVQFYDENGAIITDEATAEENILTNAMKTFTDAYAFTQGSNCSFINFVIRKKSAKYFSIYLNAGNYSETAGCLAVNAYTTDNLLCGAVPQRSFASRKPENGVWSNGDIVYNSANNASVYGWVYQNGAWHDLTY